MDEIKNGISVIICCHNGAAYLDGALEFLWKQRLHFLNWEVIFVDNNSTDNSAIIASQNWKASRIAVPFRIVQESKPGLIFARIAGIKAATYETVVFCDDDNWLKSDYLHTAHQIFCCNDKAGVLGGEGIGFFERDAPEWFSQFNTAYAIGRPGKETGPVRNRGFIAGAGMVIRKSVFLSLLQINYRFILTGRLANKLYSGEDAEICSLYLFLGFELRFDDRLVFYHYIPERRLKWRYCYQMIAEEHAIPSLTIAAYSFIFRNTEQNRIPVFSYYYRQQIRACFRRFLNASKTGNVFNNLNCFIKKKEGSKAAVNMMAEVNKLVFLLRKRAVIKSQFQDIICQLPELIKLKTQYATQFANSAAGT